MMDCPNEFTEAEGEAYYHNTENSNTDVQTDTVQNTTTGMCNIFVLCLFYLFCYFVGYV
jgi:hypothetical protein